MVVELERPTAGRSAARPRANGVDRQRSAALDLEIRSGSEGESLQPAGDNHHRACKRLLAEAGVPPWRRAQWPRLWLDGQLVALGERWLTAEFEALLKERQLSLHWHRGNQRAAAPVR